MEIVELPGERAFLAWLILYLMGLLACHDASVVPKYKHYLETMLAS